MKRILAALLLALSFPLAAHADTASKHAKLDELFSLMKLDKLMSQMMDAGMQQSTSMFNSATGMKMDPKTKAHFDAYMIKVRNMVESELSWKSLEPDFYRIYDENFTEAQIDDLLTFYKSPTGAAVLEKMPLLAQQGMQIAQTRMTKIEPKLKLLVEEFVKEVTTDEQNAAKTKAAGPKKL